MAAHVAPTLGEDSATPPAAAFAADIPKRTKPNKGWPVGKYRAEIYLGDQLASTARFAIEH